MFPVLTARHTSSLLNRAANPLSVVIRLQRASIYVRPIWTGEAPLSAVSAFTCDLSVTKEIPMSEVKVASKPKTENGAGKTSEMAASACELSCGAETASPFSLLGRFAHRWTGCSKTSAFDPGFTTPGSSGVAVNCWARRLDSFLRSGPRGSTSCERDGQLVVRADLPGLSKDDIKVDVTDDTLTIQGERTHEEKGQREGCCYSECSYGSSTAPSRCLRVPRPARRRQSSTRVFSRSRCRHPSGRKRRPRGWRFAKPSSAVDRWNAGGMRPTRAMPPCGDRLAVLRSVKPDVRVIHLHQRAF